MMRFTNMFEPPVSDQSNDELHKHEEQVALATKYTDRIIKPLWLNSLILRSNLLYGHQYRNFINAPLMSRKTQAIKQQQLSEQPEQQNVSKATTSVRESQKSLDHKSFGSGERSSKQHTESDELSLRVPDKIFWLSKCIMFLEVFLMIRFSLIFYYLSDKYPKQTMITASQPSGSLKYEALQFQQHVNLTRQASSLLLADESHPEWDEQLSCLQELELFLNQQFGRFYLWEASPGLDRRNGSSMLFNHERGRFQTILEESYAMQIIRKEVQVYCYLIACFITTCLAGSLIAARMPYDVTPLALIYDPKLVAFIIRARMKRYLELMRRSYVNYWLVHRFDDNNRLARRLQLGSDQQPCGCSGPLSGELDYSTRAAANPCLSDEQFVNYMPTVRSQPWRRFLMIAHPLSHYAILFLVVASLVVVWRLFVGFNDEPIAHNQQLKMILEGDGAQTTWKVLASDLCRQNLNKTVRLDSVRRILVAGYADTLRRHNPANYKLKLESYLNNSFPNAESARLANPLDVDLQIVAKTLAPISLPHFVYWVWPIISAWLPCFLTTLYIVIMGLTLVDLCFWLVELRLKLNICAVILKHQQNSRYARDSSAESPQSWFMPSTLQPIRLPYRSEDIKALLQVKSAGQFDGRLVSGNSGPLVSLLSDQYGEKEPPKAAEFCNVELALIFTYLFADRYQKSHICEHYAYKLIGLEPIDSEAARSRAEKFLVSTYLDFRLFLDQIDDCRKSISFLIGYAGLHALNIIGASLTLTGIKIQASFVIFAYSLANFGLVGGGFFLSQCSKLYAPIHSILALSLNGDKVVLHLASLWRRALVDLCGSRSKLSFRVYTLNISYALALQFNLSISSLYILILDRVEL